MTAQFASLVIIAALEPPDPAARVKILRGIRRHLRTTHGLDPADLEIAVALVRSQLDLSLSRQLAPED